MSITRRKFLLGTGLLGGGLIIGMNLLPKPAVPNTRQGSFQPNAWLQITTDGKVIFQLDKSEMGQGVMTTMPTLIGEELDYNPEKIIVEMAGIHPDFINKEMGVQLTGASTSTIDLWDDLRYAGATARILLIAAASSILGVASKSLKTDNGYVIAANGKRLSYGELAEQAKVMALKGDIALTDRNQYKWIGKPIPRKDTPAKVNATAIFGMDIQLEGMKTAVVVRCPHFGGKLVSFEASKALSQQGILAAFPIHSGVAIVADTYWQARKAAGLIAIKWDKGPLAELDSAAISLGQEEALKSKEPFYFVDDGDYDSLEASDKKLSVHYSAPYFHHSPMEPQNCTALYQNGGMEIWCPSQSPDISQAVIAHFTGLEREKIIVNTTLLGGGFGRRGYVDFAGEAGAIAKAYPGVPVKLVWSREDDMRHDYYRPATLHHMEANITEDNTLKGWKHDFVSTSIIQGFGVDLISTMLPSWVPSTLGRKFSQGMSDFFAEYDITMAEGAKIPYAVPNIKVGAILHDPGIPTGFWRSVGHSHNAFVVEGFTDEVAHAMNVDPAEFRGKFLQNKPRHLKVLEHLLSLCNYKPGSSTLGLAVHESFGSFVAQAAEVEVQGSQITVKRVYCVADCGLIINPDIVSAQMESGIIYGLTATLKKGVTFKEGAVIESNFHDLPVLRMHESPEIIVELIDSDEAPSGVGEIAVPPIAPAVANAVFNVSGIRLRDLPLTLSDA